MSVLQLLVDTVGFDPTRLSGRPTGFALIYTVGMLMAIPAGLAIALATPLRWASRIRVLCAVGLLLSALWLGLMQQFLFIEYPHQQILAADTGQLEPAIIPVPMPGLRGSAFDQHWYIGSPMYRTAPPAQYEEQTRLPENAFATAVTIALHWLGFMTMLICLVATSALGAKVVAKAVMALMDRLRNPPPTAGGGKMG